MIPLRSLLIPAAVLAVFLFLSPANSHDQFLEWKQPQSGTPCCSGHPTTGDCYETEAKFVNGHWLAKRREDGRWLIIPDDVVLKDFALATAYLCNPKPAGPNDERVRCFRPPYTGS